MLEALEVDDKWEVRRVCEVAAGCKSSSSNSFTAPALILVVEK